MSRRLPALIFFRVTSHSILRVVLDHWQYFGMAAWGGPRRAGLEGPQASRRGAAVSVNSTCWLLTWSAGQPPMKTRELVARRHRKDTRALESHNTSASFLSGAVRRKAIAEYTGPLLAEAGLVETHRISETSWPGRGRIDRLGFATTTMHCCRPKLRPEAPISISSLPPSPWQGKRLGAWRPNERHCAFKTGVRRSVYPPNSVVLRALGSRGPSIGADRVFPECFAREAGLRRPHPSTWETFSPPKAMIDPAIEHIPPWLCVEADTAVAPVLGPCYGVQGPQPARPSPITNGPSPGPVNLGLRRETGL